MHRSDKTCPICMISFPSQPQPSHPQFPVSQAMQPPPQKSQSMNNPGVVDLPKPRKSPAEVAAEKQKKKETAAASAKKKREQAAEVARVEKEIKVAQSEASELLSQAKQMKRSFPCPVAVDKVSLFCLELLFNNSRLTFCSF